MDVLLIVIAIVLVGRTFVAGSTLDVAEIAAIALLLPLLVPFSRLDDGMRSTIVAVLLGIWLAWACLRMVLDGSLAAPNALQTPVGVGGISQGAPVRRRRAGP